MLASFVDQIGNGNVLAYTLIGAVGLQVILRSREQDGTWTDAIAVYKAQTTQALDEARAARADTALARREAAQAHAVAQEARAGEAACIARSERLEARVLELERRMA